MAGDHLPDNVEEFLQVRAVGNLEMQGIALLAIVMGPVGEGGGDEPFVGHHDILAIEGFQRRGTHGQFAQDARAAVFQFDVVPNADSAVEQDDDAGNEV